MTLTPPAAHNRSYPAVDVPSRLDAEERIKQRRQQLGQIQERIRAFRAANGAALAGRPDADLAVVDPRRASAA